MNKQVTLIHVHTDSCFLACLQSFLCDMAPRKIFQLRNLDQTITNNEDTKVQKLIIDKYPNLCFNNGVVLYDNMKPLCNKFGIDFEKDLPKGKGNPPPDNVKDKVTYFIACSEYGGSPSHHIVRYYKYKDAQTLFVMDPSNTSNYQEIPINCLDEWKCNVYKLKIRGFIRSVIIGIYKTIKKVFLELNPRNH